MIPADEDRFCERCGVSRDLHYNPDDPDVTDCNNAERKAELIERFPL